MKIEKLRNNHKKKIVIGGVILTTALVVGILATSYSKYRVTESVKLGEGVINFTPNKYDFNLISMYLVEDGIETETNIMPSSGYMLDSEKSYCTIAGEKDNNVVFETKEGNHTFSNIQKGSNCYLYFNKNVSTIILEKNKVNNNLATNYIFFSPSKAEETSGLFSAFDEDGITYYYRGIVDNNWVDFAGFKWRIIRINGDGSLRLIYNGTSYSSTGETTQIGSKAFNNSVNDNAYVGYMYGQVGVSTYEATHANTNPSTILGKLDGSEEGSLNWWYKTNILEQYDNKNKSYDSYVSKEAGFCGDRQVDNTADSSYYGNGYGNNPTGYGPLGRIYLNGNISEKQIATYYCNKNDLYTVSASSKGNKALQYPIGLISADETVYGGGFGEKENASYWLYTNQNYWTMSPFNYNGSFACMCFVHPNGSVAYGGAYNTSEALGVRPVINLDKNVQLTGSGTTTNPYKIVLID